MKDVFIIWYAPFDQCKAHTLCKVCASVEAADREMKLYDDFAISQELEGYYFTSIEGLVE